jgi:hypothetical protein
LGFKSYLVEDEFREGDENSSKPPSSVAGRKSKEKQRKSNNKILDKEREGGTCT